ncbi:amidohydrolase [Metabacillus sediminilitoris]|uniref:Deaminase n=1 Tax=Metabacillus sediminilitoris TaxID=2567941 RepID=A0A4V3WEP8_9BACI|nr:amidohydrolase [Metabacillus sediminilitoris]QGQ45684.1 amidohydrolase family protein [Metabacillus sediminilitoris]THF77197.1 deaminase [Metabacillus sediminilitoris]
MNQENIGLSRRKFLGNACKIGSASAILGVTGTMGLIAPETASAGEKSNKHHSKKPSKNSSYMLLNVRLESGYKFENGEVVATESVLRNIQIDKGKITKILDTKADYKRNIDCYDAKGMLLLPSFKDMHIHLDKTYYGGPWKAAATRKSGIFDVIELEKTLLLELLPTAQERAEKLIELILGYGTTYVRSHCNIDPVVGLKNLEKLKLALANYSDKISHEIVAFPQHGLLRSNSEGLLREAMQLGVTHVGGVDPTLFDGDMEKSLQTTIQIAVDHKVGIDIHLHEVGETGLKTIHRLADLTEEAGLQGKVTISHGFGLTSLPESVAIETANRLASLGISIASTVPIGGFIMPIPILQKQNVNVMLGNDSITDHWDPFGIGDTLQKAHVAAIVYGWKNEYNLSRALSLATGGITPLDANGKQVWPNVGDDATAVLVPASCSAEAVARLPERDAVLHKGELSSGHLDYR